MFKNKKFKLKKNIASDLRLTVDNLYPQVVKNISMKVFEKSRQLKDYIWAVTLTIHWHTYGNLFKTYNKQTALTKIKTVVFSLFR